ncbi:MAG: ABC transporter ATP-binding protein [Chloroflexi bacterium]|nr:MAG: ABC transporter ATP-binding protein [Chloroflexota bacterium]TMC72503.1 MAG: ABC transporter ATP-binding protein [Chloroflexota bacterium]
MLGPNGAGKTTSISLLLGLRKPTSGKALLFGLDPDNLDARSRVGVMLQESGIPAVLKVREIVDLFRSYYAKPMARDRAIAMAGLEEKAEALVKELSGGQRQRLYFALAVCGDPEVLFLDEPTVGMDVEGRRSFIERIAEFARMGRTVVLTTHYLEEADQLARRVIVIDRGLVIADASPKEIKSRVAGKRVRFTAAGLTDADLEGLPVTTSTISDHTVQLLTNQPEAVLSELFRRGIQVSDLEVSGADLEDAFISLTSHRATS